VSALNTMANLRPRSVPAVTDAKYALLPGTVPARICAPTRFPPHHRRIAVSDSATVPVSVEVVGPHDIHVSVLHLRSIGR
jgi:hypothetical protein